MVFGLIGLFDAAVLVFIVIMIVLGKYGDAPPQEDSFCEGNSQKLEAGTADFVKDHDFGDDIPDVPFSKDLYDEHIPELSSYREESASFHTKRFLDKSGRTRVYDDSDLGSTRRDGSALVGTIRNSHADYSDVKKSYDVPLLGNNNKGSKADGPNLKMSTSPRNNKLLIESEDSHEQSMDD